MSVIVHPPMGEPSQNISSRIMGIPGALLSWGKWAVSLIPLVGRLVTVDQTASANIVRLGADALARKNQGALARWRNAQSNTEMADHILQHNVPSDVTSGQREVCQEIFERLDTIYSRRTQYNEFGERAAKAYPEVVDLALEGMSDDLALMKLGLHAFTDERRRELQTRCATADAFRIHLDGLKATYPPLLVDSIATTHFNSSLQGIIPHEEIQEELAYLLERTHLCDQFEEAWNQVQSLNLSDVQGNDTPLHRSTARAFQGHLSQQRNFSQMILVRERRALLDVSRRDAQRQLAFYEKIRGYTVEELTTLRDQLPEEDFYRNQIDQILLKHEELHESSVPVSLGRLIRRRIFELEKTVETLTQRVARLDIEVVEKKRALLAHDADLRRSLFDLKVVYLLDTIKTVRALPHEYFEREMIGFHKCLMHADVVNSVKTSKLYGLPFPQKKVDAIEDEQVRMMLNTIRDMAPHLAARVCDRILSPGDELHAMYDHLVHELQCVRAAGAEEMTPNQWKARRESEVLSKSERESFVMMNNKYGESLKNSPTWAAPQRVPIVPTTKVFSIVSGDLLKRKPDAKIVCIHLAKMSESERRLAYADLTKEKVLSLLGDRDSIRLTYDSSTHAFIEDPNGKIELICDYSRSFIPTVADLRIKARGRIVETEDGRIVRGSKQELSGWKVWLNRAREHLGHGIGVSKARKRSYRADKHGLMNALKTLFHHISSGKASKLTTNDYFCLMEYVDRVLEGDLAHLYREAPECRQYIEIYENIRGDLYKTLRYSDTNHLIGDVLKVSGGTVERETAKWKKEKARILIMRELYQSVFSPWKQAIENFLQHRDDPYVKKYYGRWIAAMEQILPELQAIVEQFPRDFQGNPELSRHDTLRLMGHWVDEGALQRKMTVIFQEIETRLPRINRLGASMSMSLKFPDLATAEDDSIGDEDVNGVRAVFRGQICTRFFQNTDRIRMLLQSFAETQPQRELFTTVLEGTMSALGEVFSFQNYTAALKRDLVKAGSPRAMVRHVFQPVAADTTTLVPSLQSAGS